MNALVINNLQYAYRTDWLRKEKTVLNNISLTVQAGESFGFLGHNGAGKTTAMKCILNLCKPKRGSISIFGIDASRHEARASVGYLPEQPYFYDNITVNETLAAIADLYGLGYEEKIAAIDATARRVGIADRLPSPMRSLSKGLMQRVALGQAILAKPKLLILDEPFSGLDPIGRKEFRDIFLSLKNEGVTLFISSHVLSDIEVICDRVAILSRGTIQGPFSTADLPPSQSMRYVITVKKTTDFSSRIAELIKDNDYIDAEQGNAIRITCTESGTAQSILKILINADMPLLGFETEGQDLESLFISLVKGVSQ